MRVKTAIVCFTIATAASVPAPAQSPVELYRRVVPLEATTGLVTIRESVARQLEVPERCDDGYMHCAVVRRFAHLYRIDFEVETRRQAGDQLFIEREGRGAAHLALVTTRDEEESYDELLREALSNLGAAAFDQPFAGLRQNRPPFDGEVAARTVETSWSCFDNAGTRDATMYTHSVIVDDKGNESHTTGISTFSSEDVTEPLCAELEGATATAYPEEFRTMSTPRVLLEQTLTVEVSDMLLDEAFPDELVALPEGSELSQKKTPGVSSMQRSNIEDGVLSVARTREGVEIAARITAAELPPAAASENAWHSRWVLQTIERQLGPLPENRVIENWSLTASLMPALPPRDLDEADELAGMQSGEAYAVRLDEEALFAAVAESIDFRAEVTPAVLAERIVNRVDGLGSPGWILVLCMPDGAATWGMPQAGAYADLLNEALFCSAVESYVP